MDELNNKKTQSILTSLSKPTLTENELVNSQKRVWNSLSSRLAATENVNANPEEKTLPEANAIQSKDWNNVTRNQWLNKLLIPLFVLLILVSFGGYYIYNFKNSSNEVQHISNDLKSQLTDKIAAIPQFESQNYNSSNLNTLKDSATSTNSVGGSDSVAKTNSQTFDGAIVYTIKHIGFDYDNSAKAYSDVYVPKTFDKNKYFTEFILDSAQYQKSYVVDSQNKILIDQLSTPQYMVLYQGGKYAAKINFDTPIPQDSNTFTHSTIPEREIYQNIIDSNAEDLGIQSLDNVSYHVFQVKSDYRPIEEPKDIQAKPSVSTSSSSFVTNKYFLNTSDLSLFREESYDSDGNLTYAAEYSTEKLNLEDAKNKYINSAELAGIPIKEFTDSSVRYSSELPKLSSIYEKYNVVYYDDDSAINSFNDFDQASQSPLYKIYSDKDFDPNYQPPTIGETKYLLTYTQGNISYEVYAKPQDYVAQINSGTTATSNIVLTIGNEKVSAKKSNTNYTAPDTDIKNSVSSENPSDTIGSGSKGSAGSQTNYQINTLEFTYKGKYYVITDYTQIDYSKLVFRILDKAKADEFDKVNVMGVSTTSTPETNY